LARLATLTAALGVLTAIWTVVGVYLGFLVHRACGGIVCASSNSGWVVQSLAIALLIVSGVCFIGPKSLFYLSAFFSAVLGGSVYAMTDMTGIAELTLLLYAAALVLSVIAARREAAISEQSNPMNLPVFG
jgi:hypothetical protein